MNKLKGKLCAFCIIFSAIFTYVDASYKDDLIKHAKSIAIDVSAFQRQIHFGKYPLLKRSNAPEPDTNLLKTGAEINVPRTGAEINALKTEVNIDDFLSSL